MRPLLRKLLGAILGLGLLLGALFVFKNPLLEWLIPTFFRSQGMEIQFQIEELGFHHLHLRQLQLFEAVEIPSVTASYSFFPFQLHSVEVQGKSLDLNKVLQALSNSDLLQNPPKTEGSVSDGEAPLLPFSYGELASVCSTLQKVDFQIVLPELIWGEQTLPLNLEIVKTSLEEKSEISLHFNGEGELQNQERKTSLEFARYKGTLHLRCHPNRVEGRWKDFDLQVKNVRDPHLGLELKEAQLQLPEGKLTLHQDNQIQMALRGRFNFKGNFSSSGLEAGADEFSFELSSDTENETLKGEGKIEGLSYASFPEGFQVAFLNLKGTLQITKSRIQTRWELSDSFNVIHFKEVHLSYDRETSQIEGSTALKDTLLQLGPNLTLLFPQLKEFPLPSKGQLKMGGKVTKKGEDLSGHLQLQGQHIFLTLESGQLQDVNFQHDILSFSRFRSSPGRTLSIKKIDRAQPIQDLTLRYQVIHPEKLKVESLQFKLEGADLQAHGFEFNPVTLDLNGLIAVIQGLEVQRVLTLALKEAVSSEGLLSGHLKLSIRNKKPRLEGELKAHGPDRIRYRPGAAPMTGIQLSDGPMEILKAYLYDFYYTQLGLTIKTDENYNMIMTLSTLGHNPGYLGGKPLKLNINLEQNLLAALRAMMLTYDLPEKLQKSFEEMGTK